VIILSGIESVRDFYCLYICTGNVVGNPTIMSGRVRVQLNSLTSPQFSACPNPGSVYPTQYAGIPFLCLRCKIIICIVDIGRIVAHHCLSFLLTMIDFCKRNHVMHIRMYL
jgi:hypothetical protein